jgi:peroxiredoxin
MQAYQADMAKFDATETQILGISMDSFASNKEFGTKIGVTFPLLSDWKRDATKAYGLYNETSGYGRRGTFVIDKEGIIQHVEVGNTAVDPTGAYQVCDLLKVKQSAKPAQ